MHTCTHPPSNHPPHSRHMTSKDSTDSQANHTRPLKAHVRTQVRKERLTKNQFTKNTQRKTCTHRSRWCTKNHTNAHSIPYSGPTKNKPTLRSATTSKQKHAKRSSTQQRMPEWRLKLRHARPKKTDVTSKNGLLPRLSRGLTDNMAQITGSGCIDGQTTTRPRRRTTHNTTKVDSLFSDVCRPIKPGSTHNANYFITIIDSATRYILVYCLVNRAQVLPAITNSLSTSQPGTSNVHNSWQLIKPMSI